MLKIKHGTAIYTGGGMYSVIGECDNGLYFNGNNDWFELIYADPREKDYFGDLCVFDNEWMEEHVVKDFDKLEIYKAFKDFCARLDKNEPEITKGFEEFSNYAAGEVSDYIDFTYFDELDSGHGWSCTDNTDYCLQYAKCEGEDPDGLEIWSYVQYSGTENGEGDVRIKRDIKLTDFDIKDINDCISGYYKNLWEVMIEYPGTWQQIIIESCFEQNLDGSDYMLKVDSRDEAIDKIRELIREE